MTPEGVVLQSDNTIHARQVTGLIYPALRQWKARYVDEKRETFDESLERNQDQNQTFPENGLVLRQTMRDLPRTDQTSLDAWKHNFDHLWMTKAEALSMIPSDKTVGAQQLVDSGFTRRLLLFHLVDQVRGQASPWKDDDVQAVDLVSKIVEINENRIHLELSGNAKINQKPSGKLNPFLNKKVTRDRGVDLKIVGHLVLNRDLETFERLDIVAVGDRWGADVYNARHHDLESAPIGFAFELIDPVPANPIPPSFMKWNEYLGEK